MEEVWHDRTERQGNAKKKKEIKPHKKQGEEKSA